MKKEIVFRKGYTLRVTTYENDYDHVSTDTVFIGTSLEAAKAYKHMYENLLCSASNNTKAICNTCRLSDNEINKRILEYLNENTLVLVDLHYSITESGNSITDDTVIEEFGYFIEGVISYCYESDSYRAVDKCEILYSDKDLIIDVL